ncbi:YbgC/FadM family acyl-CoA thioesterase [uncultured Methylovirgula sp.]|uniref:YbgC/FadM family acyl-CoA thioesterase n=1 Tax=uncultured Methylovirgula sp. TaxID=1285960 RepID=UPI0026119D2B|nr:YbgC/FadM family acyl-CoA thioesterase [uncultured Methylovirgula sp.]
MSENLHIHRLPVRIYYEDTDFSGVVQHVAYLRFLERGRTEFLRACGIDQSALFAGTAALAFAVRRISVDYRKAAAMDDLLSVETWVVRLGGASIEMGQQILRGAEILVTADVRVAAVAGGRAQRLPVAVAAKLAGPGRPQA